MYFKSPAEERRFEQEVYREGKRKIAKMEREAKDCKKAHDKRLASLVASCVSAHKSFLHKYNLI